MNDELRMTNYGLKPTLLLIIRNHRYSKGS